MTRYIRFNHNRSGKSTVKGAILVAPIALEWINQNTTQILVHHVETGDQIRYLYFLNQISDLEYIDEMTYKLLVS
jgi:hypothetical protein